MIFAQVPLSVPQITFNPNCTPYIRSTELPLFAHGVGKTKHPRIWHVCEVQALFCAFFSVRSIKNLNA